MPFTDRRRSLRLMVVDDNEDDIMLLRDLFEDIPGADLMSHACDGDDAIRSLIAAREGTAGWPDLMLLDLNMPGVNGFEVLRVLRDDPTLRRLPIVVLSSSDADQDVELSYELGACSYVVKATDFTDYDQRLRELVGYWTRVCEIPGHTNN